MPRPPQGGAGAYSLPMRNADWLTLLVSIVATVLIPVLVIVARNARRSGVLEQKLDDLARSEGEQNKRLEQLIAGLDRRLRWLEERIWGPPSRGPRGPRLPVAARSVGGRRAVRLGGASGGPARGPVGGQAARVQDGPHDPPGRDHSKLGHVAADLELQRSRGALDGAPLGPPSTAAARGRVPKMLIVDRADKPAGPPGPGVQAPAAAAGRVIGAGHVDTLGREVPHVFGGWVGQPGRHPLARRVVCALEQTAGAGIQQDRYGVAVEGTASRWPRHAAMIRPEKRPRHGLDNLRGVASCVRDNRLPRYGRGRDQLADLEGNA